MEEPPQSIPEPATGLPRTQVQPPIKIHNPLHPDADANGYVFLPRMQLQGNSTSNNNNANSENELLVDIRSNDVAKYFRKAEINVWRTQVDAAMQKFQAANMRAPESEEEFVDAIIAANSIILPELIDGCVYVYLPEQGRMFILVKESVKPF